MSVQKPVVTYSYPEYFPPSKKAVIDNTAKEHPDLICSDANDGKGNDWFINFSEYGYRAAIPLPKASDELPLPKNTAVLTDHSTPPIKWAFIDRKAIILFHKIGIPLESMKTYVGRVFDYAQKLIGLQTKKD